jgi:hypothetical protein
MENYDLEKNILLHDKYEQIEKEIRDIGIDITSSSDYSKIVIIDTYIIYRHSNQCRLPPKGLDKRLSSPKLLQGVSRFIGKFFKILCAEIGHVVLLPITP